MEEKQKWFMSVDLGKKTISQHFYPPDQVKNNMKGFRYEEVGNNFQLKKEKNT